MKLNSKRNGVETKVVSKTENVNILSNYKPNYEISDLLNQFDEK